MQLLFSGFGGNGATMFFLTFALLAGVLGVASKFIGGNHIRAWRSDSLAAAGSTSLIAWAITALAFGYTYILSLSYLNLEKFMFGPHISQNLFI